MSESDDPDSDKPDPDKPDETTQYSALGVVFAGVGVVFFITMDSAAIGLPFVARGIAFFAMGLSATRKSKNSDTGGDD